MTDFAWGLVGPGRIAHQFAEAAQRTPGMHPAHVQGRDAARAEAFARRWAVDGRPAPRAGTDLAMLLADPAIDAGYIATPHAQHAQHAEAINAALHADKPALCEKPLVASAARAARVVAVAREHGVFLTPAGPDALGAGGFARHLPGGDAPRRHRHARAQWRGPACARGAVVRGRCGRAVRHRARPPG